MADKEQNNITGAFFWLNPSVKENGIYQIHYNREYNNTKWEYSTLAPASLTIEEKIVYAPTFLTEVEKKEIDPKEEINELREQINNLKRCKKNEKRPVEGVEQPKDNNLSQHTILALCDEKIKTMEKQIDSLKKNAACIKNAADIIKARKGSYNYIGDSNHVAKGITAFFIKKELHHDSPTSSMWSMLQRGERIAIHLWYEEYYDNQISFERKINEAKTKAQGRLPDAKFYDYFNLKHLESEHVYYKESERFFSIVQKKDEQTLNVLREYVKGYLDWVDERTKETADRFNSKYDKTKLHAISEKLVVNNLIEKSEKKNFVSLFSTTPHVLTWNDSKKKSMPALFNLMDRITGKKIQASNLKPFVKTSSGKPIHDNMANANRANLKMVDEILESI